MDLCFLYLTLRHKVLFMKEENINPIEQIQEIKKMMQQSSRFISLSGLSGVFAGFFALAGAAAFYVYLNKNISLGYSSIAQTLPYNAEFDLAKELLDILKKATTREIANDAMELSLLIQDNTGMDTTEQAMKEYAAMELLVYQNKNEEALLKIDTIAAKYKSHSLADEILWKKANIELKLNQYEKALVDLEAITKNYSTDILADDAYFLEGKIIEEKLNQKEKAMAIYRDILQKYPGSIYGAEARKRYRQLRGDYIN